MFEGCFPVIRVFCGWFILLFLSFQKWLFLSFQKFYFLDSIFSFWNLKFVKITAVILFPFLHSKLCFVPKFHVQTLNIDWERLRTIFLRLHIFLKITEKWTLTILKFIFKNLIMLLYAFLWVLHAFMCFLKVR